MQLSKTVTDELTAARVGSGLLPVYATPAVVALMEETACRLIDAECALPDGSTTVGIHIDIQHLRASKVGSVATCTAKLLGVEGRKYSFSLEVHDGEGNLLATATHERFQVDAARFMAKLS